jgi:hypothetical protein
MLVTITRSGGPTGQVGPSNMAHPWDGHGVSPVTSAGGTDVMVARRVKTVNTQPGGKTVGAGRHRYRLRWILGIEAYCH